MLSTIRQKTSESRIDLLYKHGKQMIDCSKSLPFDCH